MNINKKRHALLGFLSERVKKIDVDSLSDKYSNIPIGISFVEINEFLKCDKSQLREICSNLFNEKEIELYDVSFKGLICTEKGFASFTDKNYLRKEREIKINKAKDFIQIFIPVLTLLLSILIYLTAEYKVKKNENQIKSLQERIEKLEKK
jgi:hypothetical protein